MDSEKLIDQLNETLGIRGRYPDEDQYRKPIKVKL